MLDLDGHFDLGLINRKSRLSVRLNALQFIIALVPISTPAGSTLQAPVTFNRSGEGKTKVKKETSKDYL